jgi:hypothetical protein
MFLLLSYRGLLIGDYDMGYGKIEMAESGEFLHTPQTFVCET